MYSNTLHRPFYQSYKCAYAHSKPIETWWHCARATENYLWAKDSLVSVGVNAFLNVVSAISIINDFNHEYPCFNSTTVFPGWMLTKEHSHGNRCGHGGIGFIESAILEKYLSNCWAVSIGPILPADIRDYCEIGKGILLMKADLLGGVWSMDAHSSIVTVLVVPDFKIRCYTSNICNTQCNALVF